MPVVECLFWSAFLVSLYTYSGYPLILYVCYFLGIRRPHVTNDSALPTVSVIIAAHNEAGCIKAKLDNCLALDYPQEQIEILVGSDGSDDGTNEIVEQFRHQGVKGFIYPERRGKMATINSLVREARGEICVFSDVSESFDADAVRVLMRHFADPSVGLTTGNHMYNRANTGLGAGTYIYWKFKRTLQTLESSLYSSCTCDGTIYACRRELFPFPPDNTINDDIAVPWSILNCGKRVIYEPRAIVRGDVIKDVSRFFRQKLRSQAGKYQNFVQFPRLFIPWPIRRWFVVISHGVLPTLVPWFMIVALITSGMLFLTGGAFHQIVFALQATFYVAALLGYFAERFRWRVAALAIPFYFVTANLGSLCGFVAYAARLQRPAWRKVE